jgi:hypothetical protein
MAAISWRLSMDAGLLTKIFGHDQVWHGPCTVVLDADVSIQTVGNDGSHGAGAKMYAPRCVSGRVATDSVCLLKDGSALVVMQQYKIQQETGKDATRQFLMVINPRSVIAIEFPEIMPLVLQSLGVSIPPVRSSGSHPGSLTRPR